MSILIGLAIVLALMLSELPAAWTAADGYLSQVALLLLTLAAPLFAYSQVHYFRRRTIGTKEALNHQQLLFRWSCWAHSAVWVLSSLSMIWLFGWPRIVREVWKLDRLPLLDEAVILLPMTASLVASWFILFDLRCSPIIPRPIGPILTRERFEFASIRCRVYLLVVLIPVAVMVAMKDAWYLIDSLPQAVSSLLAIAVIVGMFCLMPVMIGSIWILRSITPAEGRSSLLELCDDHRLQVQDIRVWDTGNQAINALVAGLVPNFRLLIVSDLLLASFPKSELQAVLRHEAGHIRLRHLPKRIGFILLPAIALAALELDPNRTMEILCIQLISNSGFEISVNLLAGLAFLAYVVVVTAWLSKNMEFEADLYAIGALTSGHTTTPNDAQSMANALRRFAQLNPEQFNRRSLTHPSLFDRLALIQKVHCSPDMTNQFRRRFLAKQRLLASAILAAMILLVLI